MSNFCYLNSVNARNLPTKHKILKILIFQSTSKLEFINWKFGSIKLLCRLNKVTSLVM